MKDHPCLNTALHEAGHLLFFFRNPTWRKIFGRHIRVTIFAPGLAILEGQSEPFTGPPKWIPVATTENDRPISFTKNAPELAWTVAKSLLSGWAAVFADREEVLDLALPFTQYGSLTLSPDFQRAVEIVWRLQEPAAAVCDCLRYDTARHWAAQELSSQTCELAGAGLAAVRRCAEAILLKPNLSLSWPEVETCFNGSKRCLRRPSRTLTRTKAATLTTPRRSSKPVKGPRGFARRCPAEPAKTAPHKKQNEKGRT